MVRSFLLGRRKSDGVSAYACWALPKILIFTGLVAGLGYFGRRCRGCRSCWRAGERLCRVEAILFRDGAMELRHLRYFVAVAEEGSLTVAAQKRLHTAQPSLSRQIHDLELELGVELLIRGPRGVELTAAGRAFLDHARVALLQVEAAGEAARRAAQPARTSFAIGFLTGYEMDWLPAIMGMLRAELPSTEVVIHSQDSPDLAAGLMRGKNDLAFFRPEKHAPGLEVKPLPKEPLLAPMPHD